MISQTTTMAAVEVKGSRIINLDPKPLNPKLLNPELLNPKP